MAYDYEDAQRRLRELYGELIRHRDEVRERQRRAGIADDSTDRALDDAIDLLSDASTSLQRAEEFEREEETT